MPIFLQLSHTFERTAGYYVPVLAHPARLRYDRNQPADMEAAIMRDPLFEQVLLIGEARSYLSVLTVLNEQAWQKIAEQEQFVRDLKQNSAAQQEKIEALLLEKITTQTSEFPGYACIRRVAAILEPWTVKNEMLTATLKLRRKKIFEHYQNEVEQLYTGH